MDGLTKKDVILPSPIIYQWITEHLLLHGHIDLAQSISKSANLAIQPNLIDKYTKLNSLLSSLRSNNLNVILEWISENEQKLLRSKLEFCVHKYYFLYLSQSNKIEEALKYAQHNFHRFMSSNKKDIYELMGSMVFISPLNNTPYRSMKSETFRVSVEMLLSKEFCRINNLPMQSHLYSCVQSGIEALPVLVKAKSVMSQEQWEDLEELNVEIRLPEELVFHSIFYCPVSKEITTQDNPPQLLPCGHVISKQSVLSLQMSRNRFSEVPGRFKCPYCPQRVRPVAIRNISFD